MPTILLTCLVFTLLIIAIRSDSKHSRLRGLWLNGKEKANWRILIPQTFINRRVGLLNTPALGDQQGLLIRGRSVHTKGMLFSLDLIALDRAGHVIDILHSVAPDARVPPFSRSTAHILELAAGQSAALALKPGDHLSFGDPL